MRQTAIALMVVAAACGGGDAATTTTTTTSAAPATTTLPPVTTTTGSSRHTEVQAAVDEWSEQNDPVGVAVAVLFPDGGLVVASAGLADREAGIPVAPTDRFEIASITKTFMSVLTLRLAEEGVLDLDETIDEWLPQFPEAASITVRNLLGHRAGVHDPSADLVSDRDGPSDYTRVFLPDELIAAAAAGSPDFEPGTRHAYSNANYWVLATIIEAATGNAIGDLLETTIFDPLGLADTVLFDSTLPPVEIVNAYTDLDLDGEPDPMGTAPLPGLITAAWTAGGIISTAADLVTFLDAVFAGQIIGEASLDAMLDTTSGGPTYGLGIYTSNGRWGHDGGIPGYLSAVFHSPASGITVAVLTNRSGPGAPQADAFASQLAGFAARLEP